MATAPEMSLIQFQQRFSSEEACEKYVFEQRWPNSFECPHCGHEQYYYISTRKLYECCDCHKQTSLTAGTIMHKSKISLLEWFWAIYLVAHDKRGKSALSLSVELGLNYRSAWRLLRKIRSAMSQRDKDYLLSGLVEMDDAYFGSPKKGRDGRGTTKIKVGIALSTTDEGNPQYLRMEVIDAVTIEEIHRLAGSFIAKGSTILTDGHGSYKRLPQAGYKHISRPYYREDKETFLKWLHTIISNAKAFINGTYHGLSSTYFQTYLDEFCYRFNRRFFPNELFGRLMNACLAANPHPVN